MANGDWDATHSEMDAGVSDPTSTVGGQETPDVVCPIMNFTGDV